MAQVWYGMVGMVWYGMAEVWWKSAKEHQKLWAAESAPIGMN